MKTIFGLITFLGGLITFLGGFAELFGHGDALGLLLILIGGILGYGGFRILKKAYS